MRQRTDSRSAKSAPAPLEKNFREIVVGNGRSQEPYIIAFHYASDNVSGSPLGTLFGFFEVEIHDQDAAYIVNFLASVAKKEYFANPRRNPVESFEVALHKINVALAEIVKHGNVSWLGHLHGALGVANQNMLHFSVTGEGELYLAREETIRSVSEGLADSESEPHPLKTFTEVSSGELFDGDLVFAVSPSVWSLFSPEDLQRSLNRLGPAGFEQFLRTALVNELPIAAVVLLTCAAPVELSKAEERQKSTKKAPVSLDNVWSEQPFTEASQAKGTPSATERRAARAAEKPDEYTDQKTGHIYVQASPAETVEAGDNVWKERWDMFSHSFDMKLRTWTIEWKKASRRFSKSTGLTLAAFGSQLALARRAVARRGRNTKRLMEERWQAHQESHQAKKTVLAQTEDSEPAHITTPVEPEPIATPPSTTIPFAQSWKPVAHQLIDRIRQESARLMTGIARLFTWLIGFWQTLAPKEKWSVIGVGAAVVLIGLLATRPEPTAPVATDTPDVPVDTPAPPVFPPADEPLATLLSGNQLLFPSNNSKSIALVTLNATSFLVTEKSIVNLKTQESTATPESLRLATAMDDLDAIFALGESGSLYLFSISTKKFETNNLPLPTGAQIANIGSYLTYLYVLDHSAGTIYRFPRAEGGFGAPTTWSKESLATGERTAFAVYENILLADATGKPVLYSRGRNANITFAGPLATISTDALAFDTRTGDVFALDRVNKRIIRWSATGTLVGQYYHESFGDIETLSVSPDGTEVLVSRQGATTAWRIQ